MMMCESCKKMIDQPPFLQPHGALSRVAGIETQWGKLERFRCAVCRTTLQRILPKGEAQVTQLHHWTVD